MGKTKNKTKKKLVVAPSTGGAERTFEMAGFYTCGPNEALVISGLGYDKPETIIGGRVFKLPFLQRIQRISLNTFTLNIVSPNVFTEKGVAVTVEGVAQVKVSTNDDMLATACEIFLDKDEDEIQVIIRRHRKGSVW